MSAPTRAVPERRARRQRRRVGYDRPRPDPMLLLWLFMPLELGCAAATTAIGAWALVVAGLLVVALIVGAAWSSRDWAS